jgi:hypothetical protein
VREDQECPRFLGRYWKVIDGDFRGEREDGCQGVFGSWLGRRVSLIDRIPDVDEELAIVTRRVHRGERRMPDRVRAKLIRCLHDRSAI